MAPERIISDFLTAMRQAGFEPDCAIVADNKLHRFRDWLDKPGSLDGWYILFLNIPASGAFGCCRRGISISWSAATVKTSAALVKQTYVSTMDGIIQKGG